MTELLSPTAPAVEMLALDEIRAFEGNSKAHPPEQVAALARSIREFGFTAPVLIDETGTLLAGHGRVLAAREVGLLSVPAIRVTHLTPDQKRAYVIADNRLTELGGWDEKALAAQIQMLMDAGVDVSVTGFDDKDSRRLMVALGAGAGKTEPDDVPAVQKKAISRRGDVWIMGRHRVVCGDATVASDWDALQVGRPAMVFSSPPYGVGINAKLRDHYKPGKKKRASLYATHTDNPDDWLLLMRQWTGHAIDRADCTVCNIQSLANNKRNIIAWSSEFSDFIADIAIWDKGHGAPQMQSNVLTNVFEWIYILAGNPGASRALPLADFHGDQSNVVRIARGVREHSDIHRATMPIALAEWAMTCPGARAVHVIDPFGGTGTTLIAAERFGKSAGIIEMDPIYVDVIIRRWQEFTGLKAVHAGDGVEFDEIATLR